MLQRSPTYVVSLPGRGRHRQLAAPRAAGEARLRHHALEERAARHAVLPAEPRAGPSRSRSSSSNGVRKALGPDYDVETHFTPRYNPWDQRLCLVPDGDLFEAIKAGSASVVTDQIETFTEKGIKLRSGARARGRPHRHRDRPRPAAARRHAARGRRPRASISPRRSTTRA